MSHVTRKPVFGVCDQVRLKLACSATETCQGLEILVIASRGIILSRQRTTKALIRLRGCAGWSAPLLFAKQKQVFSWRGSNGTKANRSDVEHSYGPIRMDGWVKVLRPFNSISVISRRWKDEHERLCAMKRRLGSGRISPPAGFEPATPWSEVGSANRSATRTLRSDQGQHCLHKWISIQNKKK